jgi:hypothetical protein
MAWVGRLKDRYRRWEARTVDRTASWSGPRRWLIFVLLPCALLCGGGILVGAPLIWFIGETVAASRGAADPAAAVNTYLMALSYDNDARPAARTGRRPGRRPDGPVEVLPGADAPRRHRTIAAGFPDPSDQADRKGERGRGG